MNSLFPLDPEFPTGFAYVPGFISEAEEKALYDEIIKLELRIFTFQGFEAKRKVANFGYDWNFEQRKLSKGKDIPDVFYELIEKVANSLSLKSEDIAELLVTEYPEGSVINWHRDAPPFETIIGISLMSDCLFRMRPHEKAKQGRGSIVSRKLERRSLYVMQGPARTDWQHSTAPVQNVRYSITLRTLSDKYRS